MELFSSITHFSKTFKYFSYKLTLLFRILVLRNTHSNTEYLFMDHKYLLMDHVIKKDKESS